MSANETIAFVGRGCQSDGFAFVVDASSGDCTSIFRIDIDCDLILRQSSEGGGVGGVAGDEYVADSVGVAIVPLYEDAVIVRSGCDGGVGV